MPPVLLFYIVYLIVAGIKKWDKNGNVKGMSREGKEVASFLCFLFRLLPVLLSPSLSPSFLLSPLPIYLPRNTRMTRVSEDRTKDGATAR